MADTLADIIERPNCSLCLELQEGVLFISNLHRFIRVNASNENMHEMLRTILSNYDTSLKGGVGKKPKKCGKS